LPPGLPRSAQPIAWTSPLRHSGWGPAVVWLDVGPLPLRGLRLLPLHRIQVALPGLRRLPPRSPALVSSALVNLPLAALPRLIAPPLPRLARGSSSQANLLQRLLAAQRFPLAALVLRCGLVSTLSVHWLRSDVRLLLDLQPRPPPMMAAPR
jgi:hypothetical protein